MKLLVILLVLLFNYPAEANIQQYHAIIAKKNATSVTPGAIGATAGEVSSPSNTSLVLDANDPRWSAYTTGTAGTINTVDVYIANGSGEFNVVITNSSGTLLVDSELQSISGDGVKTFTLDSDLEITASTSYRLGVGSKTDSIWTIGLNSGGTTRLDNTYDVENAMENLDDNGSVSGDKSLAIRGYYV